jgi:hypothetical protein
MIFSGYIYTKKRHFIEAVNEPTSVNMKGRRGQWTGSKHPLAVRSPKEGNDKIIFFSVLFGFMNYENLTISPKRPGHLPSGSGKHLFNLCYIVVHIVNKKISLTVKYCYRFSRL